eukprot:g2191.t1
MMGSQAPTRDEVGQTSQWPVYAPIEFSRDEFGGTGSPTSQQSGQRSPSPDRRSRPSGVGMAFKTQVAERMPQLDEPQRIAPPASMRAPQRRAVKTRNEAVGEAFSPKAMGKSRYDISSYGDQSGRASSPKFGKSQGKKKKSRVNMSGYRENYGEMRTKLRDYEMLAASCARGERLKQEGIAHYAMGVLHDNMREYRKAIRRYNNFVSVCQQTNDVVGAALAFNSIGIDYTAMADACDREKGGDSGSPIDRFAVPELSDEKRGYLEKSIEFHEQHLQIADERGSFVAHCNLGVAHDRAGNFAKAARHHQDALRLAIHLQSSHGQCIAVGNLGLVAVRQGDLATARACLDQHLQLVRSLRDPSAESSACQYLGLLANMQGEYAQASRYFEESRRLAQGTGETGIAKLASCSLGMSSANLRLEKHLNGIVEKATSPKAKR